MGLLGGYLASKRSQQAARSQRRWSEYMSNTSYQRGMADMRLAGLNPILAYKQGGASTPTVGMPHFDGSGEDFLGSAIAAQNASTKKKVGKSTRGLMAAQVTKAGTSSALDLASADHQTSMAASARETARLTGTQADKAALEIPWAQAMAKINQTGSAKMAERFSRWTKQFPSLGVFLGRGISRRPPGMNAPLTPKRNFGIPSARERGFSPRRN